MNKKDFSLRPIPLWIAYSAVVVPLVLFFCSIASAVIVTASPGNINITRGMNNAIQIFYQANEPDPLMFSAISNQGVFETPEGGLLGTVNTACTITLVNGHGSARESVTVPAAIIRQALELNFSHIFFRRTFTPTLLDIAPDIAEVQLRVVPSSAGQFSLNRMELAFNQPETGDTTRPSSGGRITVARNTRGLTATATLTYNGSGTLRGLWKVDGQILDQVTRHLTAGIPRITITSAVAPGFPTYASGIHRVEFEVLDPPPGFDLPVIFYYVSDEPPGPALGSLLLISPLARQHIRIAPDMLPAFSWEPVRPGVVYHFQLYGLETPGVNHDVSRVDFSESKPLVAALTREPSYTVSIFDVHRIICGIPYVWQVKAYDGSTGVAASLSRLVYFSKPPGPVLLHESEQ